MISWHHEHTLERAPARLGKFRQPSACCFIFLGITLERDVATNQEGSSRTESLKSLSNILQHTRPNGPVRISIGVVAVWGAKMNIGDMDQ